MNDKTGQINWLSPLLVAVFGGVGGLTAWIWLSAAGTPPDGTIATDIATNMFLGVVAGFVGVYALKVDTSRFLLHTLALALLCGFAWKPTLEAGRQYVAYQEIEGETQELISYARDSIEALKESEIEMAPALIEDLESVSQELIKSEASIRDPRLKLELNHVVTDSIYALGNAAQKAPEEGVAALNSVEETAMAKGNLRASKSARDRLMRLDDQQRDVLLRERERAIDRARERERD